MRLFIAEKPSVARAISNALGVKVSNNGVIECNDGSVVIAFFGHMLELAEPDCYTSENIPRNKSGNKVWRVEDLPIIPASNEWKLIPKPDAIERLTKVQMYLKKADVVVNAGDPDREGQLLVDEVIEYYGYKGPVLRYLCKSLDDIPVREALANLVDNQNFANQSLSALCRSRIDWLYGMNFTRAFTLRAERGGTSTLVPVGRVSTTTLNLIVTRDREIEAFTPKAYFGISAVLESNCAACIEAKWTPNEMQEGLDHEGRLVSLTVADSVVSAMRGAPATVTKIERKRGNTPPPIPHSLTSISKAANAKWGYTASEVLKTLQSLYETHKLTTYPRTDSGYLLESLHSTSGEILRAISIVNPDIVDLVNNADPSIKSAAFNDEKSTSHTGIIPTFFSGNRPHLTEIERRVYDLVVRSFIALFYPPEEFRSTKLRLQIGNECFAASGKEVLNPGWKVVIQAGESEDDQKQPAQLIPDLAVGDQLNVKELQRRDQKTKPPASFTDGSLLAAMENIHKFVENPEHKKILKDGEGIGTPSTRAGIIEELLKRGFLVYDGKKIKSTNLGRGIVDVLPERLKNPILTAMVERGLNQICNGHLSLDAFMAPQTAFVEKLVNMASVGSVRVAGVAPKGVESQIYKCGVCGSALIRRKGDFGSWWGCKNYPECSQRYPDLRGKPNWKKGKHSPQPA